MQKISRIYLGNCGFHTAWYDGITFDLVDPDTGEASDTVLNLENGGGKTSLLSLIFSCFETSQDRFLKHVQNRNHHFNQYFSPDGLPGVIMVEWLMPPRDLAGEPYRLVVGQAVAVKTGQDVAESDRMFFSFEQRDDLTLESVPAPKLGGQAATTLAEFSRWLYEEQKTHSGNVYITRKQADWQRHLVDERFIDLEMLRLQVSFSAQEGGIDAFLTFTNESEFLRKFFGLTLDAPRASAVRDAVASTCDRLRRKPQYQRQLVELTKFQSALGAFSDAAASFRRARAEQADVLVDGARMTVALQTRAAARRQAQARQVEVEREQRQLCAEAAAEVLNHNQRAATLNSLWHTRQVADRRAARDVAAAAQTHADRTIQHVKAARLRGEISTAQARIDELEAQSAQKTEDLRPFRERVEIQGALLRRALYQDEQAQRERKTEIDAEMVGRSKGISVHRQTLTDGEHKRRALTGEQHELDAAERSYLRARGRLHAEGLLEDADETGASAITRWTNREDQLRQEESDFDAEFAAKDHDEKEWQRKAVAESNGVVRIEGEIKAQESILATGHAEREKLSRLAAILSAAETDVVDPDSAALPPLLRRAEAAAAREVTLCDVRLAELGATKQSIDETGVASSGPDVAVVVSRLREAGVKSARPFNEYLAHAIPSADTARAMLLRDPARFLGVCVAAAELQKVNAMDWAGANLARPVVVSPVALEPGEVADFKVIIPAATDATFNLPAASALAVTLGKRLEEDQLRRAIYAARQTDAVAAHAALQSYLERFGNGQLTVAQNALEQLRTDHEAAVARKEEASAKAAEAAVCARNAQQNAQERETQAREASVRVQMLQRFKTDHEDDRAQRTERQAKLAADLEEHDGLMRVARDNISDLEERNQTAYRLAVGLESKADGLGKERAAIEFYDKTFPSTERLKDMPVELGTLRALYQDAVTTFKAEASTRLGVLEVQMQAARDLRTSKTDEFARDCAGISVSDMARFEGKDHTAMLPELSEALQIATAAATVAGSEFLVAERDSSAWRAANPTVAPASAEMEALSVREIEADLASARARAGKAASLQLEFGVAADAAKRLGSNLLDEAKGDEKLGGYIITSLALGENPDPERLAREQASLSGIEPGLPATQQLLVLEPDASEQYQDLMRRVSSKKKFFESARDEAQQAFDKLKAAAADKELQKAEPVLAAQMLSNDFDAACADATRLLEGLVDRIGTTKSNLEKMNEDFNACVEEVLVLANAGASLLRSATTKRVPAGAPYVAGKAVLKMRSSLLAVSVDVRRQAVRNYLDELIDTSVVPAKGADLAAETVLRSYGGDGKLGLQLLKMVLDESQQYVALDKISNSGGEGVVMAMFLYLVITQLRAETQAKHHKAGGGPLLLDNPFAKVTSNSMWKAIRLLAKAVGVQLLGASAIQDYNALGEFNGIVRLRKNGQNTKTGRWHLQAARYKLNEEFPKAA